MTIRPVTFGLDYRRMRWVIAGWLTLSTIINLIDRGCATGGRSVRPQVPVYVYLFRGPEAARRYEEVFGPMPSNPDQARGLVGSAEMIAESIGRFVASGATSVVLRPHESDSDLPGFASFVAGSVLEVVVAGHGSRSHVDDEVHTVDPEQTF